MPNTKTTRKAPTKAKATKAAAKPAKQATATATDGPSPSEQRQALFASERAAAGAAVSAYYAGSSLPFKAASGTFKPINTANGKKPSVRQAAAIAAMLIHSNGNVKSNGQFTRGGFTVPASLVIKNAKAGEMLKAQPESGVLGNMLGNAVRHVSGPTAGAAQREAVYAFDFDAIERDYIPLLPSAVRTQATKALKAIRA